MIFGRLEEWIWSLENDKPPTMADVEPSLALKSLAKIYPQSDPSKPTIEFPLKYEAKLRRMIALQSEIGDHQEEVKKLTKELEALSVRFAEMMMDHEHGVLETTSDKLLIKSDRSHVVL